MGMWKADQREMFCRAENGLMLMEILKEDSSIYRKQFMECKP